MTLPRRLAYVALAGATFALACGDSPTAPNAGTETIRVSLIGLGGNDAGAVLQLVGAVSEIESAESMVDVAWVTDGPSSATVVLVGPLSEGGDILVVRRPASTEALRVEVRELANAEGTVASSASARAIVHGDATP
jgi:hypothetical protein